MAETISAYDVADSFLRALGAPSTPAMRRAVAIWLRFESGGTIIGNNPWNLHSGPVCAKSQGYCPGQGSLPGQIGNRYAGPGDQNVAVFASMDAGAAASANNLIRLSPSYGYGEVIKEARAGDALGFLSALQKSSWSAGHYGYSKLTNAFAGSLNYNTTLTLRSPAPGSVTPVSSIGTATPAVATPGGGGMTPGALIWGVPDGKVLTGTDVQTITDKLIAAGLVDNTTGQVLIRSILATEIGQPWNTTTRERLQQKFYARAGTMPTDVGGAIGSIGDALVPQPLKDAAGVAGDVAAFLFDTDNWKYLGALVVGVPLAIFGFYLLAGVQTGGQNA